MAQIKIYINNVIVVWSIMESLLYVRRKSGRDCSWWKWDSTEL